ncbi:MAG TPA: hypothetical protein VFF17_06940, partial [Thermoanaerobaculia bacterium]|nr:hypothetical protein [Thermoanaerobaculia bacterium]
MTRWFAVALVLSLPVFAQERSRITITTLDRSFEAKRIEIKEAGGALTLTVTDASDATSTIPGPDVVEIGFAPVESRPAPGADDVEIVLQTGDRLIGTLGEPQSEAVQLVTSSLGTVTVPFKHIDQVKFLSHRAEWPKIEEKIERDTLFTASGDKPTGIVTSIGRGEIVYIHHRRKREVKLPTKDATLLVFVPTGQPKALPTSLYAIVQLTDGSEVRGTPKSYGAGGLVFTDLFDTERTVPAGKVAGLYFKNGRV